jgi:hypothetical protein
VVDLHVLGPELTVAPKKGNYKGRSAIRTIQAQKSRCPFPGVIRAIESWSIVALTSADDWIPLRAVVRVFHSTGSHRPNPVIGTREQRMTATDYSADVRSTSKRSSPFERTEPAATPDACPCASALGDAGRHPGRSGIRTTFQWIPGLNGKLTLLYERSYALVGTVGFSILMQVSRSLCRFKP